MDVERLEKDLATDSHKGLLATVKHGTDILTHPKEDWPSLLCVNTYMEALFLQPPVLASVDCVRMNVDDRRAYIRLVYKARTTGLDDNEKRRSQQYMAIRKLLRNHNILLEWV